jgi:hypothetical protein
MTNHIFVTSPKGSISETFSVQVQSSFCALIFDAFNGNGFYQKFAKICFSAQKL